MYILWQEHLINKAYVWDLASRIWVAFKVVAGIKQKWFVTGNCNWFLLPWQTEKDTKSIKAWCKLFIWLYYEFSKKPNLAAIKDPSFWGAAAPSSGPQKPNSAVESTAEQPLPVCVSGPFVLATFLLDVCNFLGSAGNTAVYLNVGKRASAGNINASHPVLKSAVPFWIKRTMNLSDEQMFKSWSNTPARRQYNELFRGGFSAGVNWHSVNGPTKNLAMALYKYTIMISPSSVGKLLSSKAMFHADYLDHFLPILRYRLWPLYLTVAFSIRK